MKNSTTLKQIRQRSYLSRDFDSLREEILKYANLYYKDRITDFSENSLGGLFLDMASYIGDNLSYYLDHQFNELDPNLAVETNNIQRHLQRTGVKITGDSPAIVDCTFSIRVPSSVTSDGRNSPEQSSVPILRSGTTVQSTSGINFELINDIDFLERDVNEDLLAEVSLSNVPGYVNLSRTERCISGNLKTFELSIGDFIPFRKIQIPDNNVSEILSVSDSKGNYYYEVNDLSEDTVYLSEKNYQNDKNVTPYILKLIAAPYRYTATTEIVSRLTTLTFGGGDASTFDNEVVPDPSEFAISLPNSKTFKRISLNPNDLLKTNTLGISEANTRLKITYRHGGGLSHNVATRTIRNFSSIKLFFPGKPPNSVMKQVTDSLSVLNFSPASGGENAPTIEELRGLIPSIKNSQQRIVTKEDLLSRIYTFPSKFGKVYRVSVGINDNNQFSTSLYVVSRDVEGNLIKSSDNLKRNLVRYLNEYRLISDSIDMLDCPILNFSIEYRVSIDPRVNSTLVNEKIKSEIENYFSISSAQINKPINISELTQLILSTEGVFSMPVEGLRFTALFGVKNGKLYSNYIHDMNISEYNGLIFPPDGGIFELKYPEINIIQGVI